MKQILKKMQTMGFFETCILTWSYFSESIGSKIRVTLLRMRGYDIDPSVKIHKNSLFFSQKKHAIRIGKNAFIGEGVRIKAIGNGTIDIGEGVSVDDYTYIVACSKIKIEKNTLIAANAYIIDSDHKYPLSTSRHLVASIEGYDASPIMIGSYVLIGTHAVVLKGVSIGNDCVIGAGAIVTTSIPQKSIAVGNPAKVVKKFKT